MFGIGIQELLIIAVIFSCPVICAVTASHKNRSASLWFLLGLVLGIGICWLQQRYGVVEIPAETFIVKAYPVEMRFGDILTIIVSLAAITFVISRLTVYSMIRRGETAQDTMA